MFEKFECDNCGSPSFVQNKDDIYQCTYCGTQIKNNKQIKQVEEVEKEEAKDVSFEKMSNEKKFILVKLMLCIFLGYAGVHRFIEGKIFSGLVYLFSYGIFGFGIIADIVRYAKQLAKNGGENN